jgi:hypothetical protein
MSLCVLLVGKLAQSVGRMGQQLHMHPPETSTHPPVQFICPQGGQCAPSARRRFPSSWTVLRSMPSAPLHHATAISALHTSQLLAHHAPAQAAHQHHKHHRRSGCHSMLPAPATSVACLHSKQPITFTSHPGHAHPDVVLPVSTLSTLPPHHDVKDTATGSRALGIMCASASSPISHLRRPRFKLQPRPIPQGTC